MEINSYTLIVDKVIIDGKHGPYAVCKSEVLVQITFSLTPEVWQEKDLPEPGTYVVLSNVIKKRAGWRAQHGRFLQPSDEKRSTEK